MQERVKKDSIHHVGIIQYNMLVKSNYHNCPKTRSWTNHNRIRNISSSRKTYLFIKFSALSRFVSLDEGSFHLTKSEYSFRDKFSYFVAFVVFNGLFFCIFWTFQKPSQNIRKCNTVLSSKIDILSKRQMIETCGLRSFIEQHSGYIIHVWTRNIY